METEEQKKERKRLKKEKKRAEQAAYFASNAGSTSNITNGSTASPEPAMKGKKRRLDEDTEMATPLDGTEKKKKKRKHAEE
jgi:hypothetical protein